MTEPEKSGPGPTFVGKAAPAPGRAAEGFGSFWRGWEAQLGRKQPPRLFTPGGGGGGDFRLDVRAVTAHDIVIADVRSESATGTHASPSGDSDGQVMLMHVIKQNSWRFARPDEGDYRVPAGNFMLQRNGPPTFEDARHTAASVLIVPASPLDRLVQDKLITGPASTAEMRLLLGHMHLVEQAAPDLTPAGALAARNSLLELLAGVLRQQVDSTEPTFGPALAQAAKDLADRLLADPELSPSMLAGELSVSLRTLQRAFAAAEDSVAGYIRRRRLEQARLELLSATGRPSNTELAAHWQFADSSHFVRAFKGRYGCTPTEFARGAANGDTDLVVGSARN
ncbi:helix-turn-helix domain-containing protein [Nocardia sp. NEAU-G5]|uniref:Helix-turn-helix domain-containing protein n=1 Tax=Nocardia albiluteola TaxID=2842303 RepID=A0ABS6B583_9NOCA|nr:helix-turn-helix domain-containing protein [Nocardia albiluteola]MBU3065409.1 helix-turn-helix domain-containing protein [Nocardia albiluteola]